MAKGADSSREGDFRKARERMVRDQLAAREITSPRVLEAFLKVPRHVFVPAARLAEAYEDHPVYIGSGQTVSQPYMVALMTEALGLAGGEKVLEIGTGSGYQTAILAELAGMVFTVERLPELARGARDVLENLGYSNITYEIGDGSLGLPNSAPYDAILAAAAAPSVPEGLKTQLARGAKLVIPVGTAYSQMLKVITRLEDGFAEEDVCPCIFVRLIGREGYQGP